ncbi:MAG: tetratricopeptide repeat protein [Haliscomenobacteraceae bacterium CHB4]|nr:tetratricopeptide repeat protein [Haliscomenobacteraceae bacterium CHB4]
MATSYSNLTVAYTNLSEYQKALEFNLKALAIREKILPDNHPDLATSYGIQALIFSNLGEYQKQLDFDLRALTIWEKILPINHPNLVRSYSNVGGAYRNVGEYKKGIEYAQKAILRGEASSPKHPSLHRFYANLGITYIKARHYPEAKAALEKSESLKPEERVYRGWAMYYASQKKKKQAIEGLQKAVTLGFKDLKWLETELDLKNIRKEKGYKELVEQLKKGK